MSVSAARAAVVAGRGRSAVLRYLVIAAVANLGWEMVQLPLYTIWRTGTPAELTYAVIHCTAGDVIQVGAALLVALLLAGDRAWPWRSYVRVTLLATVVGIAFTIFSEWVNVEVRRSWGYAPEMPLLPFLGTGLSPLLQWVIIPPAALALVKR